LPRRAREHLRDDLRCPTKLKPTPCCNRSRRSAGVFVRCPLCATPSGTQRRLDQVRLRVRQTHRAGRRIARVTDAKMSLEQVQIVFVENLGHQAEAFVNRRDASVARPRCRRFPVRDAAARRARRTQGARLPRPARRCQRRRTLRVACQYGCWMLEVGS